MSQSTVTSAPSSTDQTVSRPCQECGYDLRGLPTAHRCPECGHVNAIAISSVDVNWRRAVAAGLVLLLAVTIYAISAILIQPFSDEVAGTIPALNFPGPKLWVVPLLQRPIGQAPAEAGVAGTRVALLSLLAIWLITARRPTIDGIERDQTLRLMTRWMCVVLFGIAFGVLLASQGLWPAELPPYRLLLVGAVELPAAGLLYAYLRRLADQFPGRERRRALDHLCWMVPATIALAAGLISLQWLWNDPGALQRRAVHFGVGAVYGVIAVGCGIGAGAVVASLAGSFIATAFPGSLRILTGARRNAHSAWNALMNVDATTWRMLAPAVGMAMLLIVMLLGNEQILWYATRRGLGGNLPFFNFPGPKVWTAAGVAEFGSRYSWEPLVSRTALIVLNLVAIWLITIRQTGTGSLLRLSTRWLAIVAVGVVLGCAFGWTATMGNRYSLSEGWRSEFFAITTALCELPATLLLYLYLSKLARLTGNERLRKQLLALTGVIAILVIGALLMFALSRSLLTIKVAPVVLTLCGLYGALALVTTVWAIAVIASLGLGILRSVRSELASMTQR